MTTLMTNKTRTLRNYETNHNWFLQMSHWSLYSWCSEKWLWLSTWLTSIDYQFIRNNGTDWWKEVHYFPQFKLFPSGIHTREANKGLVRCNCCWNQHDCALLISFPYWRASSLSLYCNSRVAAVLFIWRNTTVKWSTAGFLRAPEGGMKSNGVNSPRLLYS